MKSKFPLNNNEFYDSFIDDVYEYNTNIDLVLIELPIVKSRVGSVISVSHMMYRNMNAWFSNIENKIKQGYNTLYLYNIEKTPAMYNPATFLPTYNFIVKECYRKE